MTRKSKKEKEPEKGLSFQSIKTQIKEKIQQAIAHPWRIIRMTLLVTGGIVWFFIFLIGLYLYNVFSSVPDLQNAKFQSIREVAVSRVQGKIDSKTKRNKYKWVRIDNINRDLLYAIVMSEDGQYFSHGGVNWDALISAIGENIKRRKLSYGASTISQQVSKNVYLSEAKTFGRKLTELFTTWEMEEHLTKNEILEVYLNVAEFGPDIYGVDHASKYYFNKSASKINAAEGAFLAILLPSPRKYHYSIFQNQHLAKRHQKKLSRILSDMLYKEYISPKQYQRYSKWQYFKK